MCVLAYLVERVLERKLTAAGLKASAAEVLDKLSLIRASQVQIGQKRLICRTEADPEQEQILQAIGAQLPPRLQSV